MWYISVMPTLQQTVTVNVGRLLLKVCEGKYGFGNSVDIDRFYDDVDEALCDAQDEVEEEK